MVETVLVLFVALFFLMLIGIAKVNYRIDDKHLLIRFGDKRIIRKIAFEDIADVKPIFGLWVESWVTSPMPGNLKNHSVTIYTNSRWRRRILITPPNPEEFITELRASISH